MNLRYPAAGILIVIAGIPLHAAGNGLTKIMAADPEPGASRGDGRGCPDDRHMMSESREERLTWANLRSV